MVKYRRYAYVSVVAAAMSITLASCKDKKDTLAQDSTLSGDLQLANRDSAAQAALNDAPPAAAPAAAPRPAPRPSTPAAPKRTASGNTVTSGAKEAPMGTIAAGSTLHLASATRVCTNNHKVGDRISATVSEAVAGSNGAVIPAGATASLEITQLKRSENARDNIQMGFAIRSVSFGGKTYPVSGTTSYAQVERVKNQPTGKDAQKVATGAAVGAVLGQVLGKNTKSTVIGGAIGAAAGAGTAAATANYEGCVPDGGKLTVALDGSVQVHI